MTYFGIDHSLFLFDSKSGDNHGLDQIDYNDFLTDETFESCSGDSCINPILKEESAPFDMIEPQHPTEENKNMNEMKVQDYGVESLVDMQEPLMPNDSDLNEEDSGSSNLDGKQEQPMNENHPTMNNNILGYQRQQMNVGMHRVSNGMNVNRNINMNGMYRVNRMNMMNWNGNGNGNVNQMNNMNDLSVNGMQWDIMNGIRPSFSVPTPVGNIPLNHYSVPMNMQMNNVTINNNISMSNAPGNTYDNVPMNSLNSEEENNSKKRKSMFEPRDLEEDDDYKLPPSKTPIIEAIIYCALKRCGIKVALQTDSQILFEVTDYDTFYGKQKSVCSKQNPTDDECSRIKTIQRWFKNFPTKKEISKSQVTTFKFSVEKSNSEDKFRKIVKIIDKLDCYINVNKRRRTK